MNFDGILNVSHGFSISTEVIQLVNTEQKSLLLKNKKLMNKKYRLLN